MFYFIDVVVVKRQKHFGPFLILDLFRTYFLKTLNAPLSDLSWKTEICSPKELRGGAFSIRGKDIAYKF